MIDPEADPPPERFLAEDQHHLRTLVAETRQAVDAGESGGPPLRSLGDALRFHVRIEETLIFPSLLSLHSRTAEDAVRQARGAQSELLESWGELEDAPLQDRTSLAQALELRTEAYLGFEADRLLPILSTLPGVTRREIGLEIQELVGKGSRPEHPGS